MAQGNGDARRAPTSAAMARFLEVSGRRWALRVVWELRVGALNFRALREACGGISPSVLQRRLHEWRESGVVEKIPRLGYRLTARGERLFPVLAQMEKWTRR
ncbi:MAG TPA: helix-turn-helix domain-containing protein [Woeseiaceae bacterium]|nr:helix-turn-helix domain-containing protein [Woeseiaceae bacterium]